MKNRLSVRKAVTRFLFMRLQVFMLLSFFFISPSQAANRYWVSLLGGNWNSLLNWSTTSGGLPGASVPGATDTAIFDNSTVTNCNINAAVNVAKFIINTGYTGTISQGANTITVSGVVTLAAGTFTGGSSNITVSGVFTNSGCAFTSTSAILELRNDAAFTGGSFTHNNGTVRFNGASSQTISGTSPVFYVLEFVGTAHTYTLSSTGDITVMNSLNTSGTLFYNLSGGTIDVKGDINSSNSATGSGGDAQININGTGTQNFTGSATAGAGALTQLTINKASGTLNLSGYPAVSNNFTYTAGTVAPGTSTFCFTHGNTGSYNITGSLTLASIEFFVNTSLLTATIGSSTTLTASGDLTLAGGGNLVINTGNINVNGNIYLTNTSNGGGGSATINIVGTGSETMDGTALTVNQCRLPVININKTSGTLSLTGNISFAANVTYTAGTVNPGTSTCYIVNNLTMTGNLPLYNLSISPAGNTTVTIASGTTVGVSNTLDLENGSNYITINTGTIGVQGNIIDNNSSVSGGGTGTILINGTGSQNLSSTGVIDQGKLPSVTINKTGGILILPSLITVVGNWTYSNGTIDALSNNSTVVFDNTLNITGTHTLNNVMFEGSNNWTITTGSATTLTVNGDMSLTGSNNLTFNTGTISLNGNLILTNTATGGGGTTVIDFMGTGSQSISSTLAINQSSLPAITINKTSGTLTFPALITVRGNWTYTSGTMDMSTNNSTVVFANTLSIGGSNHTLNNVTLEGNNNYTFTVLTGTVPTVSGTLSTTGPSNIFISTPVAGATAFETQGNISIGNTSTTGGGTGLILIDGAGAQSFSSTAAAKQGLLPYVKVQKTSGTLTMSGIISVSRDWTYVSGTVDPGTSTLVFGGNSLTISSAGMNFYNVTISTNTSTLANNLTVSNNLTISGTAVLAPGSNTINIGGNWTNWGTGGFTEATSTVNFNGTALQTLTTTGGENFTNLTLNNSSSGIQLASNAGVATTFTMTQGNINLNGNTLTLGTSATVPGTLSYSSGTITGTGSFTRWYKSATAVTGVMGLFPMGTTANYRPFTLSTSASPTTGGSVSVTYNDATTNSTTPYLDGATTIYVRKDLNWAMSTSGLAGGTYNLSAQGTGFGIIGNVNDLRLTLAASGVGTPGTNGGTTSDPQVNRTGLTQANLNNTFYIGSLNASSSPLPIKLISFTATYSNGAVRLDWATATEENNDHFTVQRSYDAVSWNNIQIIPGAGNSNTIKYYTAYDNNPYNGIAYYRIGQTDIDGVSSLSPIRSVDLRANTTITVYPNPATDFVWVGSSNAGSLHISVLNSSGRLMQVPISGNTNYAQLQVSGLAAGIYFIHIHSANGDDVRQISIRH